MNTGKSICIKSRLLSFKYAIEGLRFLVRKEPNMLIHFIAAVIVLPAGFIKQLSGQQWIAIYGSIALVWLAEIFNTCIESLCDLCCGGQYHPKVKIIKDIAAAAVLIAAFASVVTGIIVFSS